MPDMQDGGCRSSAAAVSCCPWAGNLDRRSRGQSGDLLARISPGKQVGHRRGLISVAGQRGDTPVPEAVELGELDLQAADFQSRDVAARDVVPDVLAALMNMAGKSTAYGRDPDGVIASRWVLVWTTLQGAPMIGTSPACIRAFIFPSRPSPGYPMARDRL